MFELASSLKNLLLMKVILLEEGDFVVIVRNH